MQAVNVGTIPYGGTGKVRVIKYKDNNVPVLADDKKYWGL